MVHVEAPEIVDDDDEPIVEELYSTCSECDEPLDHPMPEAKAFHSYCDPAAPYTYFSGYTGPNGQRIVENCYRWAKPMAEDFVDFVEGWDLEHGECRVWFPDGTSMDARDWADLPATRELAGPSSYTRRGVYDPEAPGRCWIAEPGKAHPMLRGTAQPFDTVHALAEHVTDRVLQPHALAPGELVVMLPGGTYVDAATWGTLRSTRQLAGRQTFRMPVQVRAQCTCPRCGTTTDCTVERVAEGVDGQQVELLGGMTCDGCGQINAVRSSVVMHDPEAPSQTPHPPAPPSPRTSQRSEPVLPGVAADIVGLASAIDYAERLTAYCDDLDAAVAGLLHTRDAMADSFEQARGSLAGHGVGPRPLAAIAVAHDNVLTATIGLHQALAALEQAAAAARHLATELTRQRAVTEAYAAAPDAGDRRFLLTE